MDGLQLIGAQEAQLVGLDEAGAFGFVLPGRFRRIIRPLSADDVVFADPLMNQPLRFGLDLLVAVHRIRCGKGGDQVGVAALQVPEVVQVPIGENDEAAVLRTRIPAGLLLADEGIFDSDLASRTIRGKFLLSRSRKSI